ncbi:MAG: signal peptidase I [Sedimentisphaerales bacterium]|nr:signal peptidase I [Sedimentisphaerales bacterium]
MSDSKIKKSKSVKQPHTKKDRATEIANIFEWLITAFILAFVFRAFVMEAFRIPTGSMADTLKGAHFRLRCRQCGYKYDYGFSSSNSNDNIPLGYKKLPATHCQSCGYYQPPGEVMPVVNGDRILVLKCIYQFFEPKRWDVIVFKNPPDPDVNYIKRLIGLPGESLQIIDGDIYIDGQIVRKPPKVQNELWMSVYDNDYQPVDKYSPLYNKHRWELPFKPVGTSYWQIDETNPLLFRMDSSPEQVSTLEYDPSIGNNFRTAYSYNSVNHYDDMPYCSDVMLRFYCRADELQGRIGIGLSKYDTMYKAEVSLSSGTLVVTKQVNDGQPILLDEVIIEQPKANKLTLVKFVNVDHQLIFEFGGNKWTYDLGRGPEDAGQIKENTQPKMEIFGSGKFTLSHVAVFRDTHYTSEATRGRPAERATEEPFKLGKDEYFVLGDNSPNSEDCRWWRDLGIANTGLEPYRVGIVPRDYLVGKALFVYWPGGFRPFSKFPLGIIPNIGQMRFIYGGSNKTLLDN